MSCYVIVLWMFAVCLFMHVLSTITNKDRLNGFFLSGVNFKEKAQIIYVKLMNSTL